MNVYASPNSDVSCDSKRTSILDNNVFLQCSIGILIAYGFIELLYKLGAFFEDLGLLPTEPNINTFIYFLLDIASFTAGSVYLFHVAKFRAINTVAIITVVGTITAAMALAPSWSWSFAAWGRVSMFICPIAGALFGVLIGSMLNKQVNYARKIHAPDPPDVGPVT